MAKKKAQGTVVKISTETTATAYAAATLTAIAGIRDIGEPDGEAQEIDTTDLNSTASEFLMGLPDNGKISLGGQVVVSDPGQAQLKAARNAQELRWIEITDSLGAKVYFAAVVPKYSDIGASVNGVVPFSATLRISGALTYV